jgi:hypothetical protein
MAKQLSMMSAAFAGVVLSLLMLAGCKNSGGNDGGNDGDTDGGGTVVETSVTSSGGGSGASSGELPIPPVGAPTRPSAPKHPEVCGQEGVECAPTTDPDPNTTGETGNHPPPTNLPQAPRPAPTAGK